jgi:hypothetical protein
VVRLPFESLGARESNRTVEAKKRGPEPELIHGGKSCSNPPRWSL